jgi:hypothetical protein
MSTVTVQNGSVTPTIEMFCTDCKWAVALHSTSVLSASRLVSRWIFIVSVFAPFGALVDNPLIPRGSNRDCVSILSSMGLKCSFYGVRICINSFIRC